MLLGMDVRYEMVQASSLSELNHLILITKLALQTAIALAVHDSEQDFKRTSKRNSKIEVDKEHFSKVAQRKKAFIEYRDSIDRQNEEQRALHMKSRAPPKRS